MEDRAGQWCTKSVFLIGLFETCFETLARKEVVESYLPDLCVLFRYISFFWTCLNVWFYHVTYTFRVNLLSVITWMSGNSLLVVLFFSKFWSNKFLWIYHKQFLTVNSVVNADKMSNNWLTDFLQLALLFL